MNTRPHRRSGKRHAKSAVLPDTASQTIPAPQKRWLHKAADIGIGVVGTIFVQLFLNHIPLYRTHLDVMASPDMQLKIKASRVIDGGTNLIFSARARVIDRGLRPGRISHITVVPAGVEPVPKADVVKFYHGTFWPWTPKTITTQFIVYETPLLTAHAQLFRFDFYDETGRLAFSLLWHGCPRPVEKRREAAKIITSCPSP